MWMIGCAKLHFPCFFIITVKTLYFYHPEMGRMSRPSRDLFTGAILLAATDETYPVVA